MNHDTRDLDFQFVTLLRESYWLLREVIDKRLEPLGLSQARWRPLLCLHLSPTPMTQVELARQLAIESPTMVRLIDRLSSLGWVVRKPCPDDRRAYHVELTPRARRLCVDIDRIVSDIRRQGLAGIPDPDLQVAISVLQRARAGYAAMAAEAAQKPPARGRQKRSVIN